MDVRVCTDATALSEQAAAAAATTIRAAAHRRGRCSLVLSGGHTPGPLYRLLATEYRHQIPWAQVDVFWVDERYVSPDAAESNVGMARDTLLDHVPCPAANIHPMPTLRRSPDAAALEYERTLRTYFGDRESRFDLVVLGLGEDGHTASLFPHSPALVEDTRWVMAVTAPAHTPTRLTLTLPVLTRAASIYVLVAGQAKARALHHVLTGTADSNDWPAAGLRAAEGALVWWADRAAAPQGP